MTLPFADQAVVDAIKLRSYLLSPAHRVGRFKAAFFRALRYSQAGWHALATDLRRHAIDNAAMPGRSNAYGQKYEVSGTLRGPTGRTAEITSVWIILDDDDLPRFVTAFPGPKP